jgi:hypothetical protein
VAADLIPILDRIPGGRSGIEITQEGGEMKTYKAFKDEESGLFGVKAKDHVLYEAMFTTAQAKRIAEIENGTPKPKDWYAVEHQLEQEGLL